MKPGSENMNQENKGMERIMIVMVAYNRKPEETPAWRSLLTGERDVIIVDNSPRFQQPAELPQGWVYRHEPTNPGLSHAYNVAAAEARTRGVKWMLITDQDTNYPPETMAKYRRAISETSQTGVGIIVPAVSMGNGLYMSPVPMHNYRCRPVDSVTPGMFSLSQTTAINSGMMIRLTLFDKAGGYNEKVFLDFSDFQFLERVAAIDNRAYLMDLTIEQSFSNKVDSKEAKLKRFGLFCRSLRNYEPCDNRRKKYIDRIIRRRCLALIISTRSLQPLKQMFRTTKKH